MRNSTLTVTLLAGAALAACHHRSEPDTATYPATTTTTTTTTSTSSGDVMATSPTYGGASSSTTTTTNRTEERNERGGMRSERREVRMGIRSLERARYELEHAGHEFGGRKDPALKAVDAALKELRMANGEEARAERSGMETRSERRAEAHELHVSLVDLERARGDMEHASHNFNGRRKEALEAVDAAIREVRLAAEHEK